LAATTASEGAGASTFHVRSCQWREITRCGINNELCGMAYYASQWRWATAGHLWYSTKRAQSEHTL